jgi:hypothetical protein
MNDEEKFMFYKIKKEDLERELLGSCGDIFFEDPLCDQVLGDTVHRPENNELFIDIDDSSRIPQFIGRFGVLSYAFECVGEVTAHIRKSKTPGHYHIVVKLPVNIKPGVRIAMQALLGSDPMREMIYAIRLANGCEGNNVLFFADEG